MTKVCKKCGKEKPFALFTKNNACKNGVTGMCLDCKNINQTVFRSNNREFTNDQARAYQRAKHEGRDFRCKEKERLSKEGLKKCSRCLSVKEKSDFIHNNAVCYKCRNGHERGFFSDKDDNGRFLKRFTEKEVKQKKIEALQRWLIDRKEWADKNPIEAKILEKKRRTNWRKNRKEESKQKERARVNKRYYDGKDKDTRIKYAISVKGRVAHKKACRKWDKSNVDKKNEAHRRRIKNLSDCYVIHSIIKRTEISACEIRKYPELIETQRIILKTKRLCNLETS